MSENNDVTAREARTTELTDAASLASRCTVLRHALGMESALSSPSKAFCARVMVELNDDEERAVETLTRMFKAAKLKADAAEVLEVEEIGNSVGPVVSPAIAALEAEYDMPIAEVAEKNHVDEDAFEEYEAVIKDPIFAER